MSRVALEDVLTIETGIKGPNQLAVKLAKALKRKRAPVIDVAVITRDSAGDMAVMWSLQNTQEVSEMLTFLHAVVLDSLKEAWVWEGSWEYGEGEEDGEE